MPSCNVIMPDSAVSVLIADPGVSVVMPDSSCSVICDDVLAATFTTPTLVSWHANAVDLGSLGCRVDFTNCTTAWSPCRVRFHLLDSETYKTAFSSPEQLNPHEGSLTITGALNRGKAYDLRWSWTSGNESVTQELVLADAIYIPADGEGDYPAEG